MRTRVVRVKRRHARSMRIAMLLLVFSFAIYLLSLALSIDRVRAPEATKPPSILDSSLGGALSGVRPLPTEAPLAHAQPDAGQRVTEELRFDALGANLLQLNSCASAEAARVEAARYVRRGAAGFLYQQDDAFLVIGACYESLEEAQKVAERLSEQEGLPARILQLSSSPVALRVTATRAQLDALVQSEAALRQAGTKLGELSYALDAGTATQMSVQDSLASLRVTIDLCYQSLMQAAGGERNQLVQGMLELLLELRQSLDDRIVGSEAEVLSFSAKIKYNKIRLRIRHMQYLDALGS